MSFEVDKTYFTLSPPTLSVARATCLNVDKRTTTGMDTFDSPIIRTMIIVVIVITHCLLLYADDYTRSHNVTVISQDLATENTHTYIGECLLIQFHCSLIIDKGTSSLFLFVHTIIVKIFRLCF